MATFDTTFQGNISWKGKTLEQIVSHLRRVRNTNENVNMFFLPNPVTKYYRRELNIDHKPCTRASITYSTLANGLVEIVDPLYPNNKGELGNTCNDCNNNTDNCKSDRTDTNNVCFRPDINARRRCRSAGMISRKFINNQPAYCTDNKQYLHSRNRTISQNEYVYIRHGDPTIKPGVASSKSNVYSANGLSNCPKYTISAAKGNNILQYVWLDSTIHTVTFPDGDYDIFDLNNALTMAQIGNFHYYINSTNNVKYVLLKISYNTVYKTHTIETRACSEFSDLSSAPIDAFNISTWNVDIQQQTPQLIIPQGSLLGSEGLGLQSGKYPIDEEHGFAKVIYTPPGGLLMPSFVPLYYKPSNYQFAVEGGVSSSARLLRLKYNEIQKAASQTVVLNQSIGSSLAYHVPTPDYPTHLKAKLGYPLTCSPKFCKKRET